MHPYNSQSYANKGSYAPCDALRIKPEFKEGFYPCEEDGHWILVRDHRETNVYDKSTAKKLEITDLGELLESVTTLVPDVEFPRWNAEKWVVDEVAKKENDIRESVTKRQSLIAEATFVINPMKDASEGDYIESEDIGRL